MNPVNWTLDFIGQRITQYPKLILILIVALTIFLGFGINRLLVVGAVGNIFNPQSQYVTEFETMLEDYASLEREIIIVIENDDILSKTVRDEISDLHLELEFLDNIGSVISIASLRDQPNNPDNIGQLIADGNFERYDRSVILQKLHEHPIAKHRLISKDGKKSIIIINLKPLNLLSASLKEINQRTRNLAAQTLTQSKFYFTGFLAVSSEIVSSLLNDQIFFVVGGAIFGFILGYMFFRHFTLIAATAVPSLISIFWTLGAMGWFGLSVNVMTNVVPTIIMVIAFADSMHMVDAMRGRLELGESRQQAVKYALKFVGPACVFTTATTSVAFFSLSFANTPIVAEFGRAAAMGTFLALFAAIVMSCLICLLLGNIFPIKQRKGEAHPNGIIHYKATRLSRKLSIFAINHAKKIVLFGVFLLISTTFVHFQNTPEYRYSENLPSSSPARHAINLIHQHLGGTNGVYYILSRKDAEPINFNDSLVVEILAKINGAIDNEPLYTSHSSLSQLIEWLSDGDKKPTINTLLDDLPEEYTNRFIAVDKKSIIITAFTQDIGAAKLRPFFRQMRDEAEGIVSETSDYKIVLTGLAAMSAEESHIMIEELNTGLLIAMVIIILLMGLVFRSSFYAFASILPNLLPIVAGGSLLYFIADGLQFTTIIALTIAFGIAVDDSIHFLYQYQQNRKKYDAAAAIEKTLTRVGPVLIATTFMLSAGLGLMFLSDLPQMSLFGLLVIFILNIALLADIAILPSIFYMKDKQPKKLK